MKNIPLQSVKIKIKHLIVLQLKGKLVNENITKLEEFLKGKLPYVIVIAAASGGRKTLITSNQSEKLQNSKTLFLMTMILTVPDDIVECIDNEGNPDEWLLSPLIRDIKKLFNETLFRFPIRLFT